jgi:two-component system sensor histidine kinase ChvG
MAATREAERPTVTTEPPATAPAVPEAVARPPAPRPKRQRRRFSTLTLSILAVNVLALLILLGGLLFLGQYRDGLIVSKIAGLTNEAEIMAGALGESAIAGDVEAPTLDPEKASTMIRRFGATSGSRARVFGPDGALMADSLNLEAAGREVVSRALPPPGEEEERPGLLRRAFDWLDDSLPWGAELPLYNEAPDQQAADYGEAAQALTGERDSARRVSAGNILVVSVAVPIQHFKKVLGALMLSADDHDIRQSMRQVRIAAIRVFLVVLGLTVLMSLFLARTIARPVRELAEAADKVRHGYGRRVSIPDLSGRHDEIGDLSEALNDMTQALFERLDAIERFAADVAHEIKNPLTSLRSAVETLPVARNDEQRRRLIEIMQADIARFDRLISDISDASRLDAELSRAETAPVDLGLLLRRTVEAYGAIATPGNPDLILDLAGDGALVVEGIEERLGQVVRNLLDNAFSFSPPDAEIRLEARRQGDHVILAVVDQGPGIPEENLEDVFKRFYTLRPEGEDFGRHSGLGLSISRQIVEAHGGTIRAEIPSDAEGRILGCRVVVQLPARRAAR